jgi:predicted enzyme related to lactoylglutathione lyase
MSSSHGTFVWYELMTTDPQAAENFYRDVVGWNMRDSGMAGFRYTILNAGDVGVGGLMELPKEARDMGARPGWLGYIAVDDVDATAEQIKQAGGFVHRAPADIPNVGRFSVVADPQHATFVLFKANGMPTPPAAAPGTPGHAGWRELYAGDLASVFPFYAKLFGWTKGEAMDMGPMGVYQIFNIGDTMAGGMMTKPPNIPAPFWNYYFNVDAIDAAVGRVTKAGGTVANGPMQVPGGSWIVQGFDPQGAMFSLLAPQR